MRNGRARTRRRSIRSREKMRPSCPTLAERHVREGGRAVAPHCVTLDQTGLHERRVWPPQAYHRPRNVCILRKRALAVASGVGALKGAAPPPPQKNRSDRIVCAGALGHWVHRTHGADLTGVSKVRGLSSLVAVRCVEKMDS